MVGARLRPDGARRFFALPQHDLTDGIHALGQIDRALEDDVTGRTSPVWQYGSTAIMPKVTFSLDHETVEALRLAARRTGKPKSLIVREAIAQHTAQEDRLSAEDRDRLLGVLRRIRRRPPSRSPAAVDAELAAIRRSRRTGWSRATR